jgi:S1-C subfamily serine protease
VDADGPAAGVVQPGDIITEINGEAISVDNPLLNVLFAYQPGDTVELTVLRDGETTQVEVTLGTRPDRDRTRGEPRRS